MRLYSILLFTFMLAASAQGQDSLSVKINGVLNTQSILMVKTDKVKQDSTQFKTPQFKQGFFCNFEDQLNRKKVPIDFSLGKSKY